MVGPHATRPALPPAPSPGRARRRVFLGSLATSRSLTELRLLRRAAVGVGRTGVIRFVHDLERDVETSTSAAQPPSSSAAAAAANGGAEGEEGDEGEDDEETEVERCSTPVPGGSSRSRRPDPSSASASAPSSSSSASSSSSSSASSSSSHAPVGSPPNRLDRATHKKLTRAVRRVGWTLDECDVVLLEDGSFLCPGFIDTHTHACQVPNIGLGQQYELLDWLKHVTFPRERRFDDVGYAREVYESVVQRMLDGGTTCAALYATLHLEATRVLADVCHERGLRALVGKCQMDRNAAPDYVERDAAASMEDTKAFVKYCRSLPTTAPPPSQASPPQDGDAASQGSLATSEAARTKATPRPGTAGKADVASAAAGYHAHRHDSVGSSGSVNSIGGYAPRAGEPRAKSAVAARRKEQDLESALVQPILTPRFAVSCSDGLLSGISALVSRDPSLRIQTHISENPGEIRVVKELFPFAANYTLVYDHFSLLTPRTILAHAIHLDASEMALLRERGCGVSHCPTSNFNLRSGAARVGEMLNRGIKVGLGTDVSGGYAMGMLGAVRDASVAAKVRLLSDGVGAARDEAQSTSDPSEGYDFTKGPLSPATLFYLATQGGAEVCSLADRVGTLEAGKEFDALLVRTNDVGWDASTQRYAGPPGCFVNEDEDSLAERLEKFLFCGDDRNVAAVWVRGRVVGGTHAHRYVCRPV